MERQTSLPLQQHPNFATALRGIGRDVFEIELLGAAPVQALSRFGFNFASRGPIWADATARDNCDMLRRSGLHIINSEGYDLCALRDAGFRQIQTATSVAELSLVGTIQERHARMKSKWRNTLRRGQKAPLTVDTAPFCLKKHNWLLDEDTKQQTAKRFRSLPHRFLYFYANDNPQDRLVCTAMLDGVPIAAMLFLVHGRIGTYHLGWSSAQGRKHAAHHLLLENAVEHLVTHGVLRLDLGTLDTVNAPGLARFKIGTGAKIRSLGGTWVRVPGL